MNPIVDNKFSNPFLLLGCANFFVDFEIFIRPLSAFPCP